MDIENQIKELEKKKLEFEIKRMERPLLKRNETWTNVFKFLASIITLGASVFLSYYAISSGILQIKKDNLQEEIREFEQDKIIISDSLNTYKDSLNLIKDSVSLTNKKLTDSALKLEHVNSLLNSEKYKSKNLNKDLVREKIINYSSIDNLKRTEYFNIGKKLGLIPNYSISVFEYGIPFYNDYILLNFNIELNDIFSNIEYVELNKIAIIEPLVISNDSLIIEFEITDSLVLSCSSPILVYLKQNNKTIFSGMYETKQISYENKGRCKKCKSEKIVVDISELKPFDYDLNYGIFHQGSLLGKNDKPLFFLKKDKVEIK